MTCAAVGRSAAVLTLAMMLVSSLGSRADVPADRRAIETEAVEDTTLRAEGPTARVSRGAEGLEVEGRFRVAVPPAVAWSVLTDYDGIDGFVSSMQESRVADQGDGVIRVHQVAVGRMLLFKRRIHTTLEIHELPPSLIRFEDVLRKDFEHYRGEWQIVDHDAELEIVYRVEASPRASIPEFVLRGMFERTVRKLLREVETEMMSRAQALARLAPPTD